MRTVIDTAHEGVNALRRGDDARWLVARPWPAGHHEWACFQAQQAGEKALRAFLYDHGRTSILGYSLRRLVRECQTIDAAFSALDDDARLLDQHYIPTRYPNGLDEETAPVDYYDQKDATRCLSSARSILGHVKPHLAS